jgi:hypothetical protein
MGDVVDLFPRLRSTALVRREVYMDAGLYSGQLTYREPTLAQRLRPVVYSSPAPEHDWADGDRLAP